MFDDMFSFVFDVDGTLCPIKGEDESYADLVPYADMVEKLREYKAQGARIVLYTSRNMRTYKGDLSLILEHTKPELEAWLAKWDIPYDEIVYGKFWPGHRGLYVDDRAVRPDEFLKYSVEELEDMCEKSRCDKNIDVVITMGGLGSRFRKAGYTVPKYMIEAKGKTLFEWSLISLEGYTDRVDKYVFLAMEDETVDVEGFVRGKCAELGITNYELILLDHLTDGQATTA